MNQKVKRIWKSVTCLLLIFCMVFCAIGGNIPARTVQAETTQTENEDTVSYTVTLGQDGDYFLCNKIPTSGPVTLTYTVESSDYGVATANIKQNGVIASASPDMRYPYSDSQGSMQYTQARDRCLLVNRTYTMELSLVDGKISPDISVFNHTDSTSAVIATDNNGLQHSTGTGNTESQYFGIYIESVVAAKLVNVTCTDASGNNLGLRVQSDKTDYTIESNRTAEDYTYLSFWDYEVLNQGDALSSPVTTNVQGITGTVSNLDKVIFTGEITFIGTGLREHAFALGGSYDGATDYTWHGICLYTETGTSLKAWNWYTNEGVTIGTITQGEPIDICIQFDEWSPGYWDVTYTVNNAEPVIVTYHHTSGVDFGPYICITPANQSLQFSSVLGANPVRQMDAVSYDLSDGDYLVSGNVTITDADNATVMVEAENPVLNAPGDYNILKRQGSFCRSQRVSLYEIGDVDLDGDTCDSDDLAALQELAAGVIDAYVPDCAAEYAADLDNDELVGATDLDLMEDILDTATDITLETVLKKYHVPSLTYDYLGGDEVMPIAGFYGPYEKGDYKYLTDDILEKVQEAGINLINFAPNAFGESGNLQALKAIALAEKYNIGYYIDDFNLNPEYDALLGLSSEDATEDISWGSSDAPTLAEIANLYGKASFYENCLGVHVVDEPYPNYTRMSLYGTKATNKQLKYYDWTSRTFNQFCNTSGFLNVTSASSDLYTKTNTTYTQFCQDVLDDTEAKVLAFDAYPFSFGNTIDNQTGYLSCLELTREFALNKNLPFWGYVAAGGDFRDESETDSTDEDKLPTEAETYWNVNTMLAFGAKGIAWFTLIQPSHFAYDGEGYDYDRNGLIGADGTTTPFYPWAQKMNQQIAAVDEVLMKSTSTGLMACGSNTTQALEDAGVTVETGVGYLDGVSTADDNEYGAIVGCFDYRDANAYYVVNYDVAEGQDITLSFAKDCDYYYIQNATKYSGSGSQVTLDMSAGEGVLVVIEEEEVGEDVRTNYVITMGEDSDYFICNKKPANGPVTLSYTVESATFEPNGSIYPVNGVVASAYPNERFPYADTNGSIAYMNNQSRFLFENWTYTLTLDLTDGKVSYDMPVVRADGTDANLNADMNVYVGEGNPESQYFGVYIASVTAARLINVTCTDAEGNDLGVYVKSNNSNFTAGEAGKVIAYTAEQYEEVKNNPVKGGYLFAGWFSDKECTKVLTTAPTDDYAYGKFVVSEVLDVKAQLTANTDANSEKTAMRFVTTVDSLDYKEVGFYIAIGNGAIKKKTLYTVYDSLVVVETDGAGSESDTTITPLEFSPASKHFATYAYWGIPKAYFDTEFRVIPYWVTLDGTEVCGKQVIKTVSMGIAKIN